MFTGVHYLEKEKEILLTVNRFGTANLTPSSLH